MCQWQEDGSANYIYSSTKDIQPLWPTIKLYTSVLSMVTDTMDSTEHSTSSAYSKSLQNVIC